MISRLLASILLCFFVLPILAGPVDSNRAQQLAINFFKPYSASTRSINASLVWTDENITTRSNTENINPNIYIFNLENESGFVILSGDDRVHPILAYNLQRSFNPVDIPENTLVWLNEYATQIKWVTENISGQSPEVKLEWELLGDANFKTSTTGKSLYTVEWNQTSPFNDKCPVLPGTTQNTVTGCLATALSIIMKYNEWPDCGVGNYRYDFEYNTGKINISEAFNTYYDWNNMPAVYNGNSTQKQKENVATLMYHCGVISEMHYGIESSGAYTHTAVEGMINHMKYDKSAYILFRDWYLEEEWDEILQNEINNYRPVLYGGVTTRSEGHQFILDGYDGNGFYKVNWGWGGIANGYYRLSALNPTSKGTGGGTGSFSLDQDAVIELKKAETNSHYTDILAFFTLNNATYNGLETDLKEYDPDREFDIHVGYIGNYGLKEFSGNVVLAVCKEDGSIKEIISEEYAISNLEPRKGIGRVFQCKIKSGIEPNDRIRLLFNSHNNAEWKWVRGGTDTTNEIILKDSNGNSPGTSEVESITLVTTQRDVTILAPDIIKKVTVYNTNGFLLKIYESNELKMSINTNTWNRGIYILKIETEKGAARKKVLKY